MKSGAFLILFFYILSSQAAPLVKPNVSLERLPEVTLNGEAVPSLKSLKNSKVILLDFWTTWCTPCKDSLPYYNGLFKKYKNQGLYVLAVSADDDIADARKYINLNPVSFPVFYDTDQKLVKHFAVEAVPTLVILNEKLEVVDTLQGYSASKLKSLEAKIKTLLKL